MTEVFALKIDTNMETVKFDTFLQFVSEEKYNKIKKLYRLADAYHTLFADILLKYVICKKTGMEIADLKFTYNKYGKPFIKNEGVYFNASHSGDWVVCAISEYPVGVDVEEVKKADLTIAKRFFSENEYTYILGKEESKRLECFFELWTLKESYIKAVGKGLFIPLSSFSIVNLNDNKRVEINGQRKSCYFYQYDIFSNYKLAVCGYNNKFKKEINFIKIDEIYKEFIDYMSTKQM